MQRDKKVGLAVGILLLGIVAALFFREEHLGSPQAPRLADPQALDKEIAEKPVLPYPTGIENAPGTGGAGADNVDAAQDDESLSRLFGGEDAESAMPKWPGAAGPPDPIARPADNAGGSETPPTPQFNAAWEVVPSEGDEQPPVEAKPVSSRRVEDESYIAYRVRKGDTLSDLAARYLGHGSRFREIFEANRDLLATPDDLRVGMQIRIPRAASRKKPRDEPPDAPPENPPPAQEPGLSQKPDVNEGAAAAKPKRPDDRPRGRFVPVRRPPLFPWPGILGSARPNTQPEKRPSSARQSGEAAGGDR